jgi:hypothetical protein
MSAPANRSDFVTQKGMLRFYFGFTFSYELIHTTTAQLPSLNGG